MADLEKIQELVNIAVKKETESLRGEIEKLKIENVELKKKMHDLDQAVDNNEQYSRKSSLILSGGSIPDPPMDGEREETTSEIRAATTEAIEKQLKVKLQGGIMACHRLRNKKRILIKFQDLADREAVYQARFGQMGGDKEKTMMVHENLTERRAAQIQVLGKLRFDQEITNYHTRNGNIYARISPDRKYAKIEPTYTKDEIMQAVQNTPPQTYNRQGQNNKPQIRNPQGPSYKQNRPDRNSHLIEDLVVPNPRQTRQQAKAGGALKSD